VRFRPEHDRQHDGGAEFRLQKEDSNALRKRIADELMRCARRQTQADRS
jgi:hypothetical protein